MKKLPKQKGVLFLSIEEFTEDDRTLVDGKSLTDFTHKIRLSGNCFVMDLETVFEWHRKYFSVFQDYLSRKLFVGKDQNLQATSCLETDLCLLMRGGGDWFQLQRYLAGCDNLKYKQLKVKH